MLFPDITDRTTFLATKPAMPRGASALLSTKVPVHYRELGNEFVTITRKNSKGEDDKDWVLLYRLTDRELYTRAELERISQERTQQYWYERQMRMLYPLMSRGF